MTHHALIIEDDPAVILQIADAMASLEHGYDTACSQEEALKRMAEKSYSYILLDIQIPARAQNGVARVQNTENLLEKIGEKGGIAPPVIILSDYVVDGLEQTVDLMRLAISLGRKGVVDIIAKPFPKAGRTLDRVIKKVLGIPTKMPKSVPLILSQSPTAPSAQSVDGDGDGNGEAKGWITVTQAARLLIRDVPRLDLSRARSRISMAASRGEFTLDGERKERRIEPVSFDAWRLKQRDRDLDDEDDEQVA